eukprot:scaffold18857_cov134-Isochrysis_galbana.AAC.3
MSKDHHLLSWNGQSGDPFREWGVALRLDGVGMTDKSGSSVCNHLDGTDMGGPNGPPIPGCPATRDDASASCQDAEGVLSHPQQHLCQGHQEKKTCKTLKSPACPVH